MIQDKNTLFKKIAVNAWLFKMTPRDEVSC
jgi:hypothetical protein